MKDQELPVTGFEPKGNQFGLRDLFNIEEITAILRPAIEQLRTEIAEREREEEKVLLAEAMQQTRCRHPGCVNPMQWISGHCDEHTTVTFQPFPKNK